ncbi:MAG: ECF-type sigma factor [Acidobacteriota bacterium]
MTTATPRVTEILRAARAGDASAMDQLLPLVYDELRRLANVRSRSLRQSFQPTELVHEAWMKLVRNEDRNWQSRRHFVNAAGTAIRNLLIDRARSRAAEKHGGELDRVTSQVLEGQVAELEQSPEELLALNAALDRLAEVDERAAQVVTLRYFAGFSTNEIADALGVTDRTVRNDWGFARAWLRRRLDSAAAS